MGSKATAIVDVHVIFVRGDHILLGRRCNTGYQDGKYSLVAGHLEVGETVQEAARREAAEEVGVRFRDEDLRCVHVMHHNSDGHRIGFFFTVKEWENEPSNAEPQKCDDLRWFKLHQLPGNLVPYVRQALRDWMSNVSFSIYGWEKQSIDEPA